ncbi:MAG: hypothetical protein E7192_01350 [Erysipelotrichaceae bacterium]|nr:hypothetical protein [Erysipelotrichaceae bacterium]
MASIAYVTNSQMIEYHRINGNRTMNFWRPSYTKKFADFNEGDYLFFLVKTSPRAKEKALTGYGRCSKSQTMTFKQMWETYEKENGYDSKEACKEAVLRASKTKTLPEKLNCIYLEDVVFFQSPVYLSEVGIHVNANLESYIYLDKDDAKVTNKILEIASESGVDMWSLINAEEQQIDIQEDQLHFAVTQALKQCKTHIYKEWEQKKIRKMMKQYLQEHTEENLSSYKMEAFCIKDKEVEVIIPVVYGKEYDDTMQYCIGHCALIKDLILRNYPYELSVRFTFVSDQDTSMISAIVNRD